jgi:hypothetical protein
MPAVRKREVARKWIYLVAGFAILATGGFDLMLRADPPTQAEYQGDPAPMIEAYRHMEAASVSNAEEQLQHQKHYMSHWVQSIFSTKFAGAALAVLLKKEENNEPAALSGMLTAIDNGAPGSAYVMKIEDGEDIAGMGCLMGTAMSARVCCGSGDRWRRSRSAATQAQRFSGVYATGGVPSITVSGYRFAGVNISPRSRWGPCRG